MKYNYAKLLISALIVLIISNSSSIAQEVEIGSWRDYLPYAQCRSVADAETKVYCATSSSLFKYDKEDNSISRLSKINGLSDIGFSKIAYNYQEQTLVIAYENCNLDLIKEDKIINLADIKRYSIIGNKTINNIIFKDELAYLACGFGIVVLDVKAEEIKETYYIGANGSFVNVQDIDFKNDTIYAATDEGLYIADLNAPNLSDYSNWSISSDVPYPNGNYSHIRFFNDDIILNFRGTGYDMDTLFYKNGGQWKEFPDGDYLTCNDIEISNGYLIITKRFIVYQFDDQYTSVHKVFNYTPAGPETKWPKPFETVMDADSTLWIADLSHSLIESPREWYYRLIQPEGPKTANCFNIDVVDNQVWIVPGGYNDVWAKSFIKDGVFYQKDNEWNTVDASVSSIMDSVNDYVSVAINPFNSDKVYVGTWDRGLLLIENGAVKRLYDTTNSSLQTIYDNTISNYEIGIGGLAFDQDGNLWVTNSATSKCLSVLKPNGQWQAFDIDSYDKKLEERLIGDVLIDDWNQKWVIIGRGHGLQVFNDNNTLTQLSDDQTAHITNAPGRGNLPSMNVLSFALDLDGELWIGTDKGIGVIYNPENVFTGYTYDAQQILVEQDGYYQYLLETEYVTAIAVDGANRKWIGTQKGGLFLISEDGTEQLLHFTKDNSPLFSNSIIDIAINHDNGEVVIGTDKGVISYRGTATAGEETHSDVLVYPNPVRPGYEGSIAVSGLVQDADVKITDIHGKVVFSQKANGGQIVWSGKNGDGKKVATGVYLVFSTNEDGEETNVAKILFIK